MRKVLVPTDFSENAFNALKYACQIFKYEKCEFFILHAYADEVYAIDVKNERLVLEEIKDKCYQEVLLGLQLITEQIKEYSPNPRHIFKTVPAFETLVDAVNDLVNQENMDIVLMGTRGGTNDRKITFGSNALRVLKFVNCPVLTIPEEYKYYPPKEVLFPTNYLIPYKRRELKLLCELTGSYRSTIHVLYINAERKLSLRQEDNQKFMKECLQKPNLVFETMAIEDKSMAISKYIVHKDIDMLVIVNSRHSYVDEMLYESTIDKLGLHIKIPFLVLQNLAR
ncbi:universal stress protein [uncultured Maribacter sp.]|uniref:universal stress protein n=1 Tax=uncultured Maribacter sp. TaxID=431308 RepID=UPI00262062B6|nr:universal stress protein [uncultured Maribacter sp.]